MADEGDTLARARRTLGRVLTPVHTLASQACYTNHHLPTAFRGRRGTVQLRVGAANTTHIPMVRGPAPTHPQLSVPAQFLRGATGHPAFSVATDSFRN